MDFITRQPVAIAAVIAIAINLVVSFGLKLTVDQIALINAFVVAVLGLFVHGAVTPTSAPVLPSGTSVMTPSGDITSVQ